MNFRNSHRSIPYVVAHGRLSLTCVLLTVLACLPFTSRAFGGIQISGGNQNVTTTYVPLNGTLTSVGSIGLWYEVREGSATGTVLDYGARKAESSWSLTLRHLKFGANVVTVKTRNSSGADESASVTLTLVETSPPTVRPRPRPTEVWWGGLSDNSQLLDPAKPWNFVKTWEDGYFIHSAQNWGDLTNTERTQLATALKPYNTKYMYETGGRSDATTDWPDLHTSRTRAGYWKSVATAEANGVYMSEVTHDYHADDIVEFCRLHPDWSNGDIRAAYTGDLSTVSGTYPSPAPAIGWGPVFSLLPGRFPYAKVAQTFSPIYFDWQSYQSLSTDVLVFNPLAEANGTPVLVNGQQVSFTFNMYDIHRQMMNSIQALGQTHYGFATDCPWQATANWSNQTTRLSNRQKIRTYESYLQGRGGKHYRICNNNSVSGSGDTYDLKYKEDSLKLMYLHQNEGGRADKYIFESWYGEANSVPYIGRPYSAAPETKIGSFSNLALDAIKYIKGIRDIAGTLQPLHLVVTPAGEQYTIQLRNDGDSPCLPAILGIESGNTKFSAVLTDPSGTNITSAFTSPEGYVFARPFASNDENSIASKLLAPGEIVTIGTLSYVTNAGSGTGGDHHLAIEVFWNPQDPTGVIRDRITLTKSSITSSTWTGGAGNGSWNDATNWGGVLPVFGDSLNAIFSSGTADRTTFVQNTRTINSLTFDAFATSPVSIRLSNSSSNVSAAAAKNLTFDGVDAAIHIDAGSTAAHTIGVAAGNVILAQDLTIDHNGPADFLINRAITGTGGLIKNGPGKLSLNPALTGGAGPNANTYSGPTIVNQGTLALSGPISSSIQIHGGKLKPQGTPTMTGDLTVASGGSIQFDINGSTPGTQYDQLTAQGNVTLAGSLALVANPSLTVGQSFTILNKSGANPVSGTFNGLPNHSTFVLAGQTWDINYAGGDGNDITLTVLQSAGLVGRLLGTADDASVKEDLVVVDAANATTLLGAGGSNPWVDRCTVYVFKLPQLGNVTNPFAETSFTFNSELKEFALKNNDLYGLGRRDSPNVLGGDYYGQTATADPTDASLLQSNILVDATPLGPISTTSGGNAALRSYLNAQYAAGAGAGKYVFLRLNTAAPKTGITRVTLTMSDSGSSGPPDTRPRIDYLAIGTPTPDVSWRMLQFGNDWDNPAIAGNLVDLDNDGIVNLLERALGGDPNLSDSSPLFVGNVVSSRLAISFNRVIANTDLTMIVRAADNLSGPWTDLARSINGAAFTALVGGAQVVETGSGSTRGVEILDAFLVGDPAHPRRFMRIVVFPTGP